MASQENPIRPRTLRINTSNTNSETSSRQTSPTRDHGIRPSTDKGSKTDLVQPSELIASRLDVDDNSPPEVALTEDTKDAVNIFGENSPRFSPKDTGRRMSVSFSPEVKLDSGNSHALDEPLPKPVRRPRGRSMMEELAEAEAEHRRAYTESETAQYDPVTGENRKGQSKRDIALMLKQHPAEGEPRFPYLQRTIDEVARGEEKEDFDRMGASLTSDSTAASPEFEEVRTPAEPPTEYSLSPIGASIEETRSWPSSRNASYAYQNGSFSERPSSASLRRTKRNSSVRSVRSARSTSATSMSPASAFLSQWGARRGSGPNPVPTAEPDDEGQEIGSYVLGKQIGFGGFSIIREAYTISSSDERVADAAKIVRKRPFQPKDPESETALEALQSQFEHEVSLWRCLKHQYILPLLFVEETSFATFAFTRLNRGGTLFDLVRSNRQGLAEHLVKRYAYELAEALRYLHEDVHVVHRDVKLENCLLDSTAANANEEGGDILLCDFGMADFVTAPLSQESSAHHSMGLENSRPSTPQRLIGPADTSALISAKPLGPSDTSTSIVGSLPYAAPEMLGNGTEESQNPDQSFGPPVDVWAFGCVLYALLTGTLPFHHTFQPKLQMMILKGEFNEEALMDRKGSDAEAWVGNVVKGCLELDPKKRWTMKQVLQSPWLEGVAQSVSNGDDQEERGGKWRL